jgi:uroporphyrinogen decarboxylase
MMDVAEKYPVRFLDGPIFYPGRTPALTHTSDGPFGVAGDLMGQTELFLAIHERPDFIAELLRIVTDKLIEYLDFCWKEEGLIGRDLSWTDDLAVGLSAESYRELVLPQEKRLRFHFDGRASLHMCGKTDHLLQIFRDELAISEFQGFGYQVDLDKVAAIMAGRVTLLGNIDPFLVQRGPVQSIREATRACIEKLAPFKGYIVQDGANIPPGTPPEHINAMMEAAEMYGHYS